MTKNEAIEKVLNLARAEIGYHEVGDNWNKFADFLDPLGITWGNKQSYAWCGEFVLCMFVQAFGVDKGLQVLCSGNPSGIPLCSAGAQYFKDAGRWGNAPHRGDIIFFNYDGGINHTGIVESVSGGVVNTIEGNTSDMVARRSYAVGVNYIAGYGYPRWDVVADVEDEPVSPVGPEKPTEPKISGLPMLQRGSYGEVVKAAKALLILRGYKGNFKASNPNFGTNVERAVLRFQKAKNLEIDGIIGPQTWSCLLGVK